MPTTRPSTPRSMSAHQVRWYKLLRSPSTDVAIMPPRGLWDGRRFRLQLGTGGCGRQKPANGGVAGLRADGWPIERSQGRRGTTRAENSVRLRNKDNAQRSEPRHERESQKCGQGSQECRTRSFVEQASCDNQEGQADQLNDCDVHADVAWSGFTGSGPSARGVAQSNP